MGCLWWFHFLGYTEGHGAPPHPHLLQVQLQGGHLFPERLLRLHMGMLSGLPLTYNL